MANDFKLHLQVADKHLRLVLRGDLTDLGIKQILQTTEAGLRVFPVVIVNLREASGSKENTMNLPEEGLRQIIAKRRQVLLKTQGNGTCRNFCLLKRPAAVNTSD